MLFRQELGEIGIKEVKAGLFGTAIHALGPPNHPVGGIPSKPALTSLTYSQGLAELTVLVEDSFLLFRQELGEIGIKEVKAGLFGTAIHALGPPNHPVGGIPSKPALTSLTYSQGQAELTVDNNLMELDLDKYLSTIWIAICSTAGTGTCTAGACTTSACTAGACSCSISRGFRRI